MSSVKRHPYIIYAYANPARYAVVNQNECAICGIFSSVDQAENMFFTLYQRWKLSEAARTAIDKLREMQRCKKT